MICDRMRDRVRWRNGFLLAGTRILLALTFAAAAATAAAAAAGAAAAAAGWS
jgi:hypothetical protein